MTVSTLSASANFLGNNSTTSFNFSFNNSVPFNSTTPLASYSVIYTDAAGNETTLSPSVYSLSFTPAVTGAIWGVGGNLTYPITGSPIGVGTSLTLSRTFSLQQLISISNQGDFAPQNIEAMGDIEEMQIQQLTAEINRAIQIPVVDGPLNTILPAAVQRANQYLAFDANGNVIVAPGTGGSSSALTSPGFNNYILSPISPPELPVSGLVVSLSGGSGVINGMYTVIPALIPTLSANSIFDAWLSSTGHWTFETQPVDNYPALPHYSNLLHVWRISTATSTITSITLMTNTYPTTARINDIAGTIDTFAEIFYLYPTTTAWSAGLTVTYGELLLTTTGNVYQVYLPGVTGSVAPTTTAPGTFVDGTAELIYYCQSSYLGMFRYGANNGTEYYFTNLGLEQVVHKTLLTGSPLGEAAGTTMASLVKAHIQGTFKHLIGNRVNSGTYAFGMKMIADGYIWLNTTVAGGTAAGSSPFSGTYTPGASTVVDGTITWLCIYTSYASQTWFWMDVDSTYLIYRSPDSTDSYASTFASLLSRYIQLTNDFSWLTGASLQPSGSGTYWTYQELFGYIIDQNLDTQISNFLTKTFQNDINPLDGSSFTAQYLEDNCESVKGYREAAYVYGVLGDGTRRTAAIANVAYIGSGVAALYDTTYNFFATNYGQDVSTWAANPTISWYPYLQAQFFPELCNVGTIDDDQFKLVRFNTSLKWTNYFEDKGLDVFPDNFLGFMAAKSWQDTTKAYSFIEKTERYFISGGSTLQGTKTESGPTDIAEWGYYLATKDALVAPVTILNVDGSTLNLLNQTGDIVPFTLPSVPSAPPILNTISGCLVTFLTGTHTTASATITAGMASNSTNAAYLTCAGYSWAASNGNAINGTDAASSTLANSATYHVFLCSGGTGTGTFVSASLTPTFPTGYATYSRRIGSFNTGSSGAPLPLVPLEIGGGAALNWLVTQRLDVNVSNLGSGARTAYTLSVPSGIKVQPIIRAATASSNSIILTAGDETDVAPAAYNSVPGYDLLDTIATAAMAPFLFYTTNASAQIGAAASGSSTTLTINTRGFIDWRRS